jgi:hypothetical protein
MCCDSYAAGMGDPLFTYATTQAQPEPVDPDDVRIELVVALNSLASDFEIATYSIQKGSEDRVNAEGAIAHAMKIHAKHNQNGRIFKNETKPADPHAALRAEYTKQVKDGTTGFYLWEVLEGDTWKKRHNINNFYSNLQYRCTDIDISCYVSKDGAPAVRMLRTEAQELQRKLGDTVEWSWKANGIGDIVYAVDNFDFTGGTYTYKAKATIKLDGKIVTLEQAESEWESKKDTHDIFYKSDLRDVFDKQYPSNISWNAFFQAPAFRAGVLEVQIRPKKPTWTGSREDVIALLKEKELL